MFCPNPDCFDRLESGTPGEYVDGVTTCPKCGATLVEHLDGAPGREAVLVEGDVEVEPVFATADRSEAAVVRSLLEDAGVPFLTRGLADQDYLGLGWAGLGLVGRGGVQFLVRSEDVATVKELLTPVNATHQALDDR
jgi:hypothetical protein